MVFHAPSVLAVNPAGSAKTVGELTARAKANPAQYSFASAGMGTRAHVAGELFRSSAGVLVVHVPFNGDGPSTMSVLCGQPQIQSGKLRVLAETSTMGVPLLPDVPTLEEAGLPGFDLGGWCAAMLPAGTPAPIVEELNKAFITVVNDVEVTAMIKSMGGIPVGSTPEEVIALIRRDIPRWAAIAKASGATRN